MTRKYRGKYRVDTTRAKWWNYSSNGTYFITICTKFRMPWFGNVHNGRMQLSAMGHIANSCWYEIPNHFPFVELGAHIIMPDHVHGIVVINKPVLEAQNFAPLTPSAPPPSAPPPSASSPSASSPSVPPPSAPPPSASSPSVPQSSPKNRFGPQSQNLASIVRGFKIGVTKNARLIDPEFTWQSLYYDRIILDQIAYQRVSNYIKANPENWGKKGANSKGGE